MTSDFTIVELTDLDFVSTNLNVIQNLQMSTSSVASDHCSDIDLIAKDVEPTTSRAPKRSRVLVSRSFKQDASSSPIIAESGTSFSSSLTPVNTVPEMIQIQKNKKKLSDLALNYLEQPLLCEQDIEVQKNKKNKRSSKRIKK
ncbi:13735_t:CDS:2 [Racocetra fulgida]|uniref:13735_t:CDS:1 n=1 Tax=Racocetra fulgida TaxID=60492 RepID=A0A9N9BBG5_9GLOM|nr:13735_t:CDS:2 [Racocetra fulgida]